MVPADFEATATAHQAELEAKATAHHDELRSHSSALDELLASMQAQHAATVEDFVVEQAETTLDDERSSSNGDRMAGPRFKDLLIDMNEHCAP